MAVDFHINRNIKVVAITGPNTGGKTAALKGLGLSLLMARAGLLIPSTNNPHQRQLMHFQIWSHHTLMPLYLRNV